MSSNVNVTPKFVLAGEATFTVSNGKGKHFTYHVYRVDPSAQYPAPSWFIKVKNGPDDKDWAYLAKVVPPLTYKGDPHLKRTGRSMFKSDADQFQVAEWALRVIWQVARGQYTLPAPNTIQHDGRCSKCGAKLTHPASLATGMGPECAAAAEVERAENQMPMCIRCGKRRAVWPIDMCAQCAPSNPDYATAKDGLFDEDNIGHPGHPSNFG